MGECFSGYNGWQYLLFPFIAAVCLFPGIVVLVTRYLGKESAKPAQSFQPKFWWFEGILMLRRLILTFFSVAPFSEDLRQGLLTCGCTVVLLVHMQWQPFNENRVNLCESLLLGILVMISSLSILASHEVDSSATNDVISVLVLLPVPIVLFLIPWREDMPRVRTMFESSSIGRRLLLCIRALKSSSEPSDPDSTRSSETPVPSRHTALIQSFDQRTQEPLLEDSESL